MMMSRIHNKLAQRASVRGSVFCGAQCASIVTICDGRVYATGASVAINVDHIQGHPFSPR